MTQQHDVVRRYLLAMQRGAEAEDELVSLFDNDAEYIESFSGERTTHRGLDAIRAWVRDSWPHQPPDIVLTIERLDVDRGEVRAEWTCHSSAFETPSRGRDTYLIRNGRIQRLETAVLRMPTLRPADAPATEPLKDTAAED